MKFIVIWHPAAVPSCGEVFLLEIWDCFLSIYCERWENWERSKRKPLWSMCENDSLWYSPTLLFCKQIGGGQCRKCWVNICFGEAHPGRAQRSGLADAGDSGGCSNCSHTWARSFIWVAMLVPVAAEATGDVEATALSWAEAMTEFLVSDWSCLSVQQTAPSCANHHACPTHQVLGAAEASPILQCCPAVRSGGTSTAL